MCSGPQSQLRHLPAAPPPPSPPAGALGHPGLGAEAAARYRDDDARRWSLLCGPPACWRLAVVAQPGRDRHPLRRLTSGGLGPGKAGGVSAACSCPVLAVGGCGDCSWPQSCLSNWTLSIWQEPPPPRPSLDVRVPSALGVGDGAVGLQEQQLPGPLAPTRPSLASSPP